MDITTAREFLQKNHQAVLVTRRGAQIYTSPVLVVLDETGCAVVSTRETAYKTKHIRRDPRVSLCVLSNGFFGSWIHVDGTATVLSLPEAMEPLVDYYRRANGEHPNWQEYRQAMIEEQRVLLRITMERAGPDHTG